MIQTVILDLDGPILDGRIRHYTCYRQVLTERGYAPVSLENYWRMKRERVGLIQQLAATGAEAIHEEFVQAWLELIERSDLLSLDRPQPGVPEKLQQWRDQGVRLVLGTVRRYSERLDDQLAQLRLNTLFDHVVVCEQRGGGRGKAKRVTQALPHLSPERCLWIGDTGVDIEAARAFGCRVWSVTCGLRSESYLESLSPDFLSQDLTAVNLSCRHAY